MDLCDFDGCEQAAPHHYTRTVTVATWDNFGNHVADELYEKKLAYCDEHKPQELLTR